MDIYEISGFKTGIDLSGVNFLSPADSFENLENGFIYRQELVSRLGFSQFASRLDDNTRVMGIFEDVLPDGTRELLVCSKSFLYVYNSGTNTFDQIPNNVAGSTDPFGISDNEDYVSGTTYLTKTGKRRFIFTGRGMTDIYFYDGENDVQSFTKDNDDYSPPPAGELTRAKRVIGFGERLNFFAPVIEGFEQNQSVLFSGIRDISGNGDKFDVSSSGTITADTYEEMKGAFILGNIIIMTFNRSNWSLEKTRDNFNPYFSKKIPSVLGTDAGFSAVSWDYEVKTIGKTGLLTTDGRQSKRFDNLIPHFTDDNISNIDFQLTYGGFDRRNGQFLFSYLDSLSNIDPTTQDKVLVYNYEEKTWAINDQRFSVFGQTDAGHNLVWNDIDETQDPSWARMDTTEETWNKIGIGEQIQKTLAGDNLGFVYEINQSFDDYFVMITAISQTSSAVITIDEAAFQLGDRLIFQNVEGMTEINGLIGTVTLVSSVTSVTVDINSTNFTTYTQNGSISKTIDFRANLIPFNPYREQGRLCYVSHLEFLLNNQTGGLNVDILMDEEQSLFKTVELTTSSLSIKAREWITVIVNQEADFLNFVLRRESAQNQTIIPAIRIHASLGALKAG